MLLSNIAALFYEVRSGTGVEDYKFVKFALSAGTYSIGDFMQKLRQQFYTKGQEQPQIKDLKPVIPEH